MSKENNMHKALVFIPDISGFTQFSHNTDIVLGKHIIKELLHCIIDSNFLNLKISEIEGDAVLFYRYGKVPEINTVLIQYENMLINFKRKLHDLNVRFQTKIDLSLKLIVHYGPVLEYRLNKFKKLYGDVVVESHILLKNSIKSRNYVLFTKEAILGSVKPESNVPLPEWITMGSLTLKRKGMDDISFSYYEYNLNRLRPNVIMQEKSFKIS
ncbi:MAG: DUF2652 domain-containing protein [Sediminicola sp.]